jgi:hypothetical protein
LEYLFKIIDEDGGGSLDLEEFKQFTLSEEANLEFRKIVKRARKKNSRK